MVILFRLSVRDGMVSASTNRPVVSRDSSADGCTSPCASAYPGQEERFDMLWVSKVAAASTIAKTKATKPETRAKSVKIFVTLSHRTHAELAWAGSAVAVGLRSAIKRTRASAMTITAVINSVNNSPIGTARLKRNRALFVNRD